MELQATTTSVSKRRKPLLNLLLVFLFPLFILLHQENEYHHLIDYRFVVKDVTILLLIPWIFFGVSLLLFRKNSSKAVLFSFFLCLIFYFTPLVKTYFQPHFRVCSGTCSCFPLLRCSFFNRMADPENSQCRQNFEIHPAVVSCADPD
jgi:hypothetical protein